MRLVTCIGSISSGKTCLLNILQQQASDGKCFSIEDLEKIAAIQEQFNYKPNKEVVIQSKDGLLTKSKYKNHKRERLKVNNKVAPTTNENLKQVGTSTDKDKNQFVQTQDVEEFEKVETKPIYYSNLIGKTAPTIGVNHFQFTVDDLTLQVAGEYWKRKKNKSNNICKKFSCSSSAVNSDRIDAIELRELGGEIAPLWKSMIANSDSASLNEKSKCLMFLVDASNSAAYLSESAIHLIETLNYLQTTKKHARVLIIYSKVDIIVPKEYCLKVISNIKQLLRTSYLKNWYNKDITIREVEYSAVTGQGIDDISYWLNHCYLY